MKLKKKLAALDQIYKIYDNVVSGLDLACKKHCSHCCTTGITLTTVEGYKIIKLLDSDGDAEWIQKIKQASKQPHFLPQITTNQLANMCAQGIEPPAEESSEWKSCPFLTEKQCPIYAVRPFGCRCMVSRHDCGKEGYADMDDFVLSVNTLFLQTIEHLDTAGCSGNLLEVLGVLAAKKNRQAYEDNRFKCGGAGLLANQPLEVLMIPPEHRAKMEPILQSLREIRI